MALASGVSVALLPKKDHSLSCGPRAAPLLRRISAAPGTSRPFPVCLGASRGSQEQAASPLCEEQSFRSALAEWRNNYDDTDQSRTKILDKLQSMEIEVSRLQELLQHTELGLRLRERAFKASEQAKEDKRFASDLHLMWKQEIANKNLQVALEVKGLNHIKGLFERFQDTLRSKLSEREQGAKGVDLWEIILVADEGLAMCVARSLRIPACRRNDLRRLAKEVYQIHADLCQHLHDGGQLDRLESYEGVLCYEMHPMSREQAGALECIASTCGFYLEQFPSSETEGSETEEEEEEEEEEEAAADVWEEEAVAVED